MKRIFFVLIISSVCLVLSKKGEAFWLTGPEMFSAPITTPRSQGAPESTNPLFILTADSFMDDEGKPTRVSGADFSHGEGVVTAMGQEFQNILQKNPHLPYTLLQLVTFDGKTLALYDRDGPVTDPQKIPQGARRIVVFLADIPGEKQEGGRWQFSGDAVYKTLVDALEQLKQMKAAVIVNLSMSAGEQAPILEELMRTYKDVLFVASADGYPGKYAESLSNVLAVGNLGDKTPQPNTIYAEGYVEIPGKGSARGSSFAVPKAVMTAALAWQVNGNINSGQLREIIVAPTLEANADPPGRLNSQASLEMAKNYTPSFFPVWGSPSFDFHQPFGFLW